QGGNGLQYGSPGSVFSQNKQTGAQELRFASRHDPEKVATFDLTGDYRNYNLLVVGVNVNAHDVTLGSAYFGSSNYSPNIYLNNIVVDNLAIDTSGHVTSAGSINITSSFDFDRAQVASMKTWSLPANKDLVVDNFIYEMQGDEVWDSLIIQNTGKVTHSVGALTDSGADGVVL
ncbi:hypothetical protein, partial [Simiduia curdlanivorans]